MGFGGSLPKEFEKKILKCEPFGICLLNSKANSAQFGWEWAGLAGYLAGKSQTAPTIFFSLPGIMFFINFLDIKP